jgi:hypothetical protein
MVDDWMRPRPVPANVIVRIDEKYAYPHPAVAFKMEIVKEEGDTVWLRGIPPEDPESALHKMWITRERDERAWKMQLEWQEKYGTHPFFLDFNAEIIPPPSMDSIELENVRSGLPFSGLWQMNFAIDDMNEDGHPDLVLPPTRRGVGRPYIYLGSGDGSFARWKTVGWANEVPFDYGGVATADFDQDGHRDVVLGIHFKDQYVLYGDGKGMFKRSQLLPSPDPRISTRAPTVADFDGDGRDDVAFLAEVDFDRATNQRIKGSSTVWTVLNTEDGWRLRTDGLPGRVIGDNLEAKDLNGDGRPDITMASNSTNWRRLVYFNQGEEEWKGPLPGGVLSQAQHPDLRVMREGETAQVFASFVQFQQTAEGNTARTGVIRYTVGEEGISEQGTPLVFDDQRFNPVFRIGVGDLNGDGRTDLVASRKNGDIAVYIQAESGEYFLERSPELVTMGRAYDIQLEDLNGDGLDDLLISFAPEGEDEGGVGVWLSRKAA